MKAVLLIVEDEDAVQKTWIAVISRFNRMRTPDDLEFEPLLAATTAEAEAYLHQRTIDCVITDLRLDQGAQVDRGEDVIAEVRKLKAAPVAIMSGHLEEYEPDDADLAPIKKFVKEGSQYQAVLEWFNSLRQLITVSTRTQQKLQKVLAELFHHSLWRNWKTGALEPDSINAKVRHLVTQIGDEMTAGITATKLWAEEFYVQPSIRAKLLTGDLLKIDEKTYVVVTPPCDLANAVVPESILLAFCEPVNRAYSDEVASKVVANPASATDRLRQYLNQEKPPGGSNHFLPKYGDMGPWFVSFKKLSAITRPELDGQRMGELLSQRFASISPLFVPNLTHRFSAYLGRPGQPDIDPAPQNRSNPLIFCTLLPGHPISGYVDKDTCVRQDLDEQSLYSLSASVRCLPELMLPDAKHLPSGSA